MADIQRKPLLSRNKLSATELKSKFGKIDFVENPHKPGKLFFTCGSITGYISPAVLAKASTGQLKIEDMDYAQCKNPDLPDVKDASKPENAILENGQHNSNWVDCLMMHASNNVKYTF